MKQVYFIFLTLWSVSAISQGRLIRISPTFEWVDEKEKQIMTSFEGGGSEYSYERLINSKVERIDSVVVWVDGQREKQEGKTLDESRKGIFLIKESTDTVWFYSKKRRTEFYFYPEIQYIVNGFNLFFVEKAHLMIRSGVVNLPFDISYDLYTLNRNYEKSPDNALWHKNIDAWSKKYGAIIMSRDDHRVELNFMGQSASVKKELLNTLLVHPMVASISVQLENTIRCSSTYFIQSNISIYTEVSPEKVNEIAMKYGFTPIADRRRGNSYELRYDKSKLLDKDYVLNSRNLINALGAVNASHQFFSEVRLD
jgi:hypothetical protein